MVPRNQIIQALHKQFPEAEVKLIDTVGDQDHYDLEIADKAFANKSKIQQHKMVYAALGQIVGKELHALRLITKVKN